MRPGGNLVWQRQGGLSIAGHSYDQGVTVQGSSDVTIDLNRACSAYESLVGVDDMSVAQGPVRFTVFGDGTQLWQSPLLGKGDAAVPVHADLTGHKTVRLVVTPAQQQEQQWTTTLGAVALADWAESAFMCS
jgi:hypothetical protein